MRRLLDKLRPYLPGSWVRRAYGSALDLLHRKYWVLYLVLGFAIYLLGGCYITSWLPRLAHNLVVTLAELSGGYLDDGAQRADMAYEEAGALSEIIRNLGYTLAAILGALAIYAALPFQIIKVWVNERATSTTEQTNITTRINEAVKNLGATQVVKVRRRLREYHVPEIEGSAIHAYEYEGEPPPLPEWYKARDEGTPPEFEEAEETRPVIEIRLGALYALERIAQDSERDHIPIMETLCAYVRENAPGRKACGLGLPDLPPLKFVKDKDARKARRRRLNWFYSEARRRAGSLPPSRTDVQTALTILGRREMSRVDHEHRRDFRLDLRDADLRRADFSKAELRRAYLSQAKMEGANLSRAKLEGADLLEAQMEGANLSQATMEGADLSRAKMEGAILSGAEMEGANLSRAKMDGAILSGAEMEGAILRRAEMEGANLSGAKMEGANLSRAKMDGANLSQAKMEGADLSGVALGSTDLTQAMLDGAAFGSVELVAESQITDEQLASVFGDASVTVMRDGERIRPAEIKGWCTGTLEDGDFYRAWRTWREERGLPWPPPGRALAWFASFPPLPRAEWPKAPDPAP